MTGWRLLESAPVEIGGAMETDRRLFEKFQSDPQALPLLHIYRTKERGMTVGHSWKLSRWQLLRLRLRSFLKGQKPQLHIRPTGGGLVEHGEDLIYSVVARKDTFPTFGRVRTSYLSFHEVVLEALQNLGAEPRLLRCDEVSKSPSNRRYPVPFVFNMRYRVPFDFGKRGLRRPLSECFKDPVATDVLEGNRKVAGGAQRRSAGVFLHQGSVRIPAGKSFEDLKGALVKSFEEKFGAAWKE